MQCNMEVRDAEDDARNAADTVFITTPMLTNHCLRVPDDDDAEAPDAPKHPRFVPTEGIVPVKLEL
jgi:hypothetical protein